MSTVTRSRGPRRVEVRGLPRPVSPTPGEWNTEADQRHVTSRQREAFVDPPRSPAGSARIQPAAGCVARA